MNTRLIIYKDSSFNNTTVNQNSYVGHFDLDLDQDTDVSLSYNIADVREPEKKKTNFSKTISLPGTKNNSIALSQLFEISIDSTYNTNKKVRAVVTFDNIEVFKGVMRLDKITHGEYMNDVRYDITLFGSLHDIFSIVGDSTLSILDLSKYNHTYDSNNVIQSWGPNDSAYVTYSHGIMKNGIRYGNFVPGPLLDGTTDQHTDSRLKITTTTNHNYSVGDHIFIEDKAGYPISTHPVISYVDPTTFWNKHWQGSSMVILVISDTEFVVDKPYFKNWDPTSPGANPSANGVGGIPVGGFTLECYKVTATGEGYLYPMINYKKTNLYDDWDLYKTGVEPTGYWVPSVYVKTLIDEIFNYCGYTYDSTFFNTEFFKRLVLPYNTSNLKSNNTLIGNDFSVRYIAPQSGTFTINNNDNGIGPGWYIATALSGNYISSLDTSLAASAAHIGGTKIGINTDDEVSDQFNNFNNTTFEFKVNNAGQYRLYLDFSLNMKTTGLGIDIVEWPYDTASLTDTQPTNRGPHTSAIVKLVDKSTARVIHTWKLNNDIGSSIYDDVSALKPEDRTNSLRFVENFDTILTNNAVYKLEIEFDYRTWVIDTSSVPMYGVDTPITVEYEVDNGSAGPVLELQFLEQDLKVNDTVTLSAYLPEIKIKDFLIDIFNMFNIAIEADSSKINNMILEPLDYFYTGTTIDWTTKLDTSRPLEIQPIWNIKDKTIKHSYKDDQDVYNTDYKNNNARTYGDTLLYIDNDFVTTIKDNSLKVFSPSVLVDETRTIPTHMSHKKTFTTIQSTSSDTKYNPRILYYPGTIYSAYNFSVEPANFQKYYPYAGHQNYPIDPHYDLNFNFVKQYYYDLAKLTRYNLFNVYHSNEFNNITSKDSKLITVWVYLKPADLNSISFRNIIHIDGKYFRLNKIENYSPVNRVTKCELVQIGSRIDQSIYFSSTDTKDNTLITPAE